MRAVISFSILLGLVWNTMVVRLMGGHLADVFRPSWLLAGAIAGAVAGWFTVWSRKRQGGAESFLYGVATYHLGMLTYWASFVVFERVWMCLQHGAWTDFDLRDHLVLIWLFFFYGTICFGILLIPLSFLSRYFVWRIYRKFTA
jgi:hypothetical protein